MFRLLNKEGRRQRVINIFGKKLRLGWVADPIEKDDAVPYGFMQDYVATHGGGGGGGGSFATITGSPYDNTNLSNALNGKSNSAEFNTLTDLRAFNNTPSIPSSVELKGLNTVGDGGGGLYYWDALSTELDNGISVIKLTSVTTGRYKLQQREVPRGYRYPQLTNFRRKFTKDSTSVKICWVGDSTSDFSGNAATIPTLLSQYVFPGEALGGFPYLTNMPNYGTSGNTIASFSQNRAQAKGINALIAEAPDLIIFSYGINDVRVNNVTKDQLKAYIIAAIDQLRAGLPNCDFILRMPNNFLTTDVGGNGYVQQGSYPSLAAAAQAQSDILYQAYKELENYWPNVVLFNTQDTIFTRTSVATDSLHNDQIHPTYPLIVSGIVDIISGRALYMQGQADNAVVQNASSPWLVYPRVCEDTTKYDLVFSATLKSIDAVNQAYVDVALVSENQIVTTGDIFVISDTIAFESPSVGQSIPNSVTTRFLWANGTVPAGALGISGGRVRVYRPKYFNDTNIEAYYKDNTKPYRRRLIVASGGTNFIDISAIDTNIGVNKNHIISKKWQLTANDTLVVKGLAPLPLTGAGFSQQGNNLRIQITGSFSSYAGKLGGVFGNHDYEQPYLSSVASDPLGVGEPMTYNNSTKVMRAYEDTGLKSLTGQIYTNIVVPTTLNGTTSNISTGVNFAPAGSPTFLANALTARRTIQLEAYIYVNSSATPGNLTISFLLNSTTILTTGAIALPANLVNRKMLIKGFFTVITAGASGTVEAQAEGQLYTSASAFTPIEINSNTTIVVNTTVAITPNIQAIISGGNVGDTVTLRSFRIIG